MSFKTKYALRNYFIDFIGMFFSFSLLLLVYAKIEGMKYDAYTEWVRENPTHKFMHKLNMSSDNYWSGTIAPIIYWIPLALVFDIAIRYFLKKYNESK